MNACHVIHYPTGRFGLVGRVPITAETCRLSDPPTRSQVMGQRWIDIDGRTVGWDDRSFDTALDALQAARTAGANPCTLPDCACRALDAQPLNAS